MDKFWQAWIEGSLRRNCDPEEILEVLLHENFDLSEIRIAMGSSFPESSERFGRLIRESPSLPIEIMQKRESLVLIQRALLALNPRMQQIDRRSHLTREDFLEQYYAANRPVVLIDLMANWRAVECWTPDYLKAVCGDTIVEIQSGRESNADYEIDHELHRREVRFGDYVDMVFDPGSTNDYYLTSRNYFWGRPGTRALLDDLEVFPEYLIPNSSGVFLWFGPKGTVTPLHRDIFNTLLCQVVGRKRVKLIPANELDLIYEFNGAYSQVDCEKPDYDLFPKYRDATVIEVEVSAGEVLFIPVGWWHHVRALDPSITVSFVDFVFANGRSLMEMAGCKSL